MNYIQDYQLFETEANELSAPKRIQERLKRGFDSLKKDWNIQNALKEIQKNVKVDPKPSLNKLENLVLKIFSAQWGNIKQGTKGSELSTLYKNEISKFIKEEAPKYLTTSYKTLIKSKYLFGGKQALIKDVIKEFDPKNKSSKLPTYTRRSINKIRDQLQGAARESAMACLYGEGGSNQLEGMEKYDKNIRKWMDDFESTLDNKSEPFLKFVITKLADVIWL